MVFFKLKWTWLKSNFENLDSHQFDFQLVICVEQYKLKLTINTLFEPILLHKISEMFDHSYHPNFILFIGNKNSSQESIFQQICEKAYYIREKELHRN